MTAKRQHPLTRAEVEQRVHELKIHLATLELTSLSSSRRRQVAGTKAAINVMERKLGETPE